MSVWNNSGTKANWQGNGGAINSRNINVSSITADIIVTQELIATTGVFTPYVEAPSISSLYGSIGFLSNLVLNTDVIQLGISPTILTAEAGVLYVNGDAVAFPSSFSTIADWSQFKAVANVDMSRSSIYNVQSISTNVISTGTLATNNVIARGLSTLNVSSGNITFDTLNGRAGTVGILSGSNLVYNDGIFSNISAYYYYDLSNLILIVGKLYYLYTLRLLMALL